MALEPFRFQQFSVRHTRSGMRVCTDATIFGAMAPVRGGERVLDIGAGSGLLSLMAAQLGAGEVVAVELAVEAYGEAVENFADSPWSEWLRAVHGDIQSYARESDDRFDLIVSNPPFFHSHDKSTDPLRKQARHTDSLRYVELVASVRQLLASTGTFYVLLPVHGVDTFCGLAVDAELNLRRRTDIRAYAHKAAKVAALTFRAIPGDFRQDSLTLYDAERVYTKRAEQWLRPYLLRFADTSTDSQGGLPGG